MFDINIVSGFMIVIVEGILFVWFLHRLLDIYLKKSQKGNR